MLKLRPLPKKPIGERLLEAGHPIYVHTPGDPTKTTRIYPDGRREVGRWNDKTNRFEPCQQSSFSPAQMAPARHR